VIGSDKIVCAKCGKVVPIFEKVNPDPSLILWAFVERLGGLSGKALYFRRILEVEEYADVVYEGWDTIYSKPGESEIISNDLKELGESLVKGFRRWDPRTDQTSIRNNQKAIYRVRKAYGFDTGDLKFLPIAEETLLDKYFRIEDQQREYLGTGRRTPRGSRNQSRVFESPMATMLSVRIGKVVGMEWCSYKGRTLPLSEEINSFLSCLVPKWGSTK
jgi:hypothetical protein